MYRNRQYIRGGRDVTSPQIETFIADGNMLAFACGYPINSITSIVVNAGPASTFGLKGIDDTASPLDYYWAKGDPIVVARVAPLNLDSIVITYIGQYDILALATNEDEIDAQKTIEGSTTTGFVDDMADEPKLDDRDAAFDSAVAKLDRYGVNSTRLHYDTLGLGLRPGQIQTVTYPTFGLAQDMLIESVVFRGMGTEILHEITAIQGPEQGSWAQYFKRLSSQKDEVMEKLNVGGDQILIILVTRAETWEWTELVTETVYACWTCDGVICSDGTRIVC